MLICPVCKEKLIQENKTFRCVNNHSFDCAKQGYVTLMMSISCFIKCVFWKKIIMILCVNM